MIPPFGLVKVRFCVMLPTPDLFPVISFFSCFYPGRTPFLMPRRTRRGFLPQLKKIMIPLIAAKMDVLLLLQACYTRRHFSVSSYDLPVFPKSHDIDGSIQESFPSAPFEAAWPDFYFLHDRCGRSTHDAPEVPRRIQLKPLPPLKIAAPPVFGPPWQDRVELYIGVFVLAPQQKNPSPIASSRQKDFKSCYCVLLARDSLSAAVAFLVTPPTTSWKADLSLSPFCL